MTPLLVLITLLPISSKVVVHGGGTCPWSELVTAELSVAAVAESRPPYHADLKEADDELRVELHRPDGSLVTTRTLRSTKDCSTRARAVAVMIATWLGGEPVSDATGAENPSTNEQKSPAEATTISPDRSAPRSKWGAAASLTPLTSVARDGAVPGLAVGGGLSWSPWGSVRASLSSTSPYSFALAQSGSVRWRRTAISLEPSLTLRSGKFRALAGAGPAAALVDMEGVGLATNAHPIAGSLGVRTGISAGLDLGAAVVSFRVAGSYWPGRQEVVVNNTVEGTLPKVEVQLGVELEWEIRRVRPL
jgi:hypothetical protein